jgi:hypothetical protein
MTGAGRNEVRPPTNLLEPGETDRHERRRRTPGGSEPIPSDGAGFDVFATTEHHFHSEGYETSVAPLLLYADFAARTKRIKLSPLGLVLPSWDPLRAAEELAVLDHLTQGRLYAGFARGYQTDGRTCSASSISVTGAPMDGSAIDNHNRKVYEETLKVIKMAWTQETVQYKGEYHQIPYPYEEGIRRRPVAEWTRTYRAPGELDDEGVIRRICVVPKPYQQPHSQLFEWLARVGGDGDLECFGWSSIRVSRLWTRRCANWRCSLRTAFQRFR